MIFRTGWPMRVTISYTRSITGELWRNWKNKRHTGMKVSWRYEIEGEEEMQSDYRFAEENKYFTLLANVIHGNGGVTQDMEDLLVEIRENKKLVKSECEVGILSNESRNSLDKRFVNITHNSALYKQEISEQHLNITARIYFDIVFCPNLDPKTINFYQNLIKNFPLETIWKTFTRILLEANKNKLKDHYHTAKEKAH